MVKIDTKLQEKLTTAYMNLFDAMTAVYLANDLSQGESLYRATGAMHTILSELPRTPISEFLIALFNTHKKTVAKKSMLMPGMAETPVEIVVPNDIEKQLNLAFDRLVVMANWPTDPSRELTFEIPKFPPLPEIVIQNDVRDMKPKHNYVHVKQPIIQPKNFVRNYNLRNARRRVR